MDTYTTRSLRFFFQSISNLKKESGSQRWNEICEDAATLFEYLYKKNIGNLTLSHEQVWELLFQPPEETNDPLYMRFEILCADSKFLDMFMIILQSLLDPPALWWQAHYN